ncbi:3-isopropylmalate dehydratase large subunit [Acidisphaera sp. S103]|uniref:3-isopropylmalate dehydratase large subunit n=1 Tax=Acidisphaera sp. S103 TaxID=1747223 RepID=UPI00131A8A7E|nr:3-isopropylmalate dehydratase large subunit [Acidisphaera sp. S103]
MKTLYQKIWDTHAFAGAPDGSCLLYIDRHLLNEVSSPQAFDGLRDAGRAPWNSGACLAIADHNVPTANRAAGIADPLSRAQVAALAGNAAQYDITFLGPDDARQGIEHVVGPELGATLPGITLVCGDSHTSTHGAFACLAFGIGTSEVEHVLATQTLRTRPMKTMLVRIDGTLGAGVTAKDVILSLIGRIGTGGATGHAIEYAGSAIRGLSMEGRMTICNMSIEAGARAGLIAVDDTTIDYVRSRPYAPSGAAWTQAEAYWRGLVSDPGAEFDRVISLDAAAIVPQVSWGTSPGMVVAVDGRVPDPDAETDAGRRESQWRALRYMGLTPHTPVTEIALDKVFIGSCTNSRIEDLRAAAAVVRGRRKAASVRLAMVVPGSTQVKLQAEREGLDRDFLAAGFEWRDSGCSMCMAMNDDRLSPGERCASTSNRNFEGRQGSGGRTHLVSPAMAAAAAIAGRFVDVRDWTLEDAR